jgi:hypothetical protein
VDLVRLFEARTLLEDLAVIARLRRLGIRNDVVFHREGAVLSPRALAEVTGGGALRLVQLDSLEIVAPKGPHARILRDHFRDLGQVRANFDMLLSAATDEDPKGILERLAKLVPELAAGLDLVKDVPVVDHLTAEDANEIVQRHRTVATDYGPVAAALAREAERLGARHETLPLLAQAVTAIGHLLEQQILFCPKPIHGEKAYDEWVAQTSSARDAVGDARAKLERLSSLQVWAAG